MARTEFYFEELMFRHCLQTFWLCVLLELIQIKIIKIVPFFFFLKINQRHQSSIFVGVSWFSLFFSFFVVFLLVHSRTSCSEKDVSPRLAAKRGPVDEAEQLKVQLRDALLDANDSGKMTQVLDATLGWRWMTFGASNFLPLYPPKTLQIHHLNKMSSTLVLLR